MYCLAYKCRLKMYFSVDSHALTSKREDNQIISLQWSKQLVSSRSLFDLEIALGYKSLSVLESEKDIMTC